MRWIPVLPGLLDVNLDRLGNIIAAKISEKAHVNFEKALQKSLRGFFDIITEKRPVLVQRKERWATDRNVTSHKYGRKRPALVVALVRKNSAQNILVVRD